MTLFMNTLALINFDLIKRTEDGRWGRGRGQDQVTFKAPARLDWACLRLLTSVALSAVAAATASC